MNTLRAKITALVVAAILIVIGLAVWLFFMLHPYPPPAFERLNDLYGTYLSVILDSGKDSAYQDVGKAMVSGEAGRFGLKPEPAAGEVWEAEIAIGILRTAEFAS